MTSFALLIASAQVLSSCKTRVLPYMDFSNILSVARHPRSLVQGETCNSDGYRECPVVSHVL